MKKYWTVPLLLCLLLSGCSAQGTPKTDSQVETTAVEDTTAAAPTTEETTEQITEPVTEPQRSWQEIYAEVICEQQRTADNSDWMSYDLIYIDADDVPELYVSHNSEYTVVYTILDNAAAELHPYSFYRSQGFTSYMERQGVYYTSTDGGAGHGSMEIWHVENGVSEMTDVYRFAATSDYEETDYFRNDTSITKGEFDAALEKKENESQRVSAISFDEIMREIGYTPAAWQEQYRRIVEEANSVEEPDMIRYALFYLNDDSIPELCIYDSVSTAGSIYSCLAGLAEEIYSWDDYQLDGLVGYTEKSGNFYLSTVDAYGNMPCATIFEWKFQNGAIELQHGCDFEISPDDIPECFLDPEEPLLEWCKNYFSEDMQNPNYVSYEECLSMMESFGTAEE